jgi:hypothetical protein
VGEAKRKTVAWSAFYGTLSPSEQIAADTARKTYDRFVAPAGAMGMCYRVAFFLTTYLHREHGVPADAVVGYARDQTGPLMASHAWVEIAGRKTDLSLAFTETPEIQLPGEVLIFDHVYKPGHRYTYHRKRDDAANEVIRALRDDPQFAPVVEHKETEHANMAALSRSLSEMEQFLNAAPDGLNYEALARLIRP